MGLRAFGLHFASWLLSATILLQLSACGPGGASSPAIPRKFKTQKFDIQAVKLGGFKRSHGRVAAINASDSGEPRSSQITIGFSLDNGKRLRDTKGNDAIEFDYSFRAPDSSYSTHSKSVIDTTRQILKSVTAQVTWRRSTEKGRAYVDETYTFSCRNLPYTIEDDGEMVAEAIGNKLYDSTTSLTNTTVEYYHDTGNERTLDFRKILKSPNEASVRLTFVP
jgi:hypothetical protein